VIGLDFLALLRFLAKLVWRGDRIRPGLVTWTFFRRYAALNSVNT